MANAGPSERDPLLPSNASISSANRASSGAGRSAGDKTRTVALFSIVIFVLIWVATFSGFRTLWYQPTPRLLPKDPLERARAILEQNPLIDGHIDLPILARARYSNKIQNMDLERADFPGHINIPALREGRVGGFFWSAYVPCPPHQDEEHFNEPSWRVRDTLEQIDVSKNLMRKYPSTFEFVTSANGIRGAFSKQKIASLIGLEGGHQLGNSLAALRQYFELGVRYITLTHTCNNAFAGSCGMQGRPIQNYGLTSFGHRLIHEMNRLGMIVDLSHTSPDTCRDVLKISKAPVIFSHSNARALHNVSRNVEDEVLDLLVGSGKSKKDGLVMATFAPQFVGEHASLDMVADHIEYVGGRIGRDHVGIGSDFDGILSTPTGLENASKYPDLFAGLIRRGWSDAELVGLAGGNFLRVFEEIEAVASDMKDVVPDMSIYEKRTDLPLKWD